MPAKGIRLRAKQTNAIKSKRKVSHQKKRIVGREWIESLSRIAFFIYIASIPWESLNTPLGTPTQLTGVIFLSTWFASLALGASLPKLPTQVVFGFWALAMWPAISIFWSVDQGVSMVATISRVFLILSAVAIAQTVGISGAKTAQVLATSSTLMSLWVIRSDSDMVRGGRVSFAGIDENILAFNLCIGLACAAYILFSTQSKILHLLNLSFIFLIGFAVVLTGSRAGFVSLVCIGLIAAITAFLKRKILVAIAVSSTAWILWWVMGSTERTPGRIMDFVKSPVATDSRSQIIDQFLTLQSTWEIWGIGVGADANFLLSEIGSYRNAHSGFWKTWIELGLIGLIISGLFFVTILIYAWSSPNRILITLSLGTVIPFIVTLGPLSSNALWLLVGLSLMGVPCLRRQNGIHIK